MAISYGDDTNTNSDVQKGLAPDSVTEKNTTQQAQSNQYRQDSRQFTHRASRSSFSRRVQRGSGDVDVNLLLEDVNEIIKLNNLKGNELKLIPFSSTELGVPISGLVVAEGDRKDDVAYVVIEMGTSYIHQPPHANDEITQAYAYQQDRLAIRELPTLASELFNEKDDAGYRTEVARFVKERTGANSVVAINHITIPEQIRFPNKDVAGDILYAANDAIEAYYDKKEKTRKLDAQSIASFGSLTIRPEKINDDLVDACGMPIRADIGVVTNISSSQTGYNSTNLESNVYGFIDFLFREPQLPVANTMPYQFFDMSYLTRRYVPIFIVTGSLPALDARSVESFLLSLASLPCLNINDAWVNTVFSPAALKGDKDPNDLTLLGLDPYIQQDGKPSEPVIVSSLDQSFNLIDFKNRYCFPYLGFAVDHIEGSELGHITGLFANATVNNVAQKVLIDAADNITGGNFSRIWNEKNINSPITVTKTDISTGIYIDNGKSYDTREISFLPLLRNGLTEEAQLWQAATGQSPAFSQLERLNIINRYTSSNYSLTAYGKRCFIAHDFLTTILEGMHRAGIKIHMNTFNPASGYDNRNFAHYDQIIVDPSTMSSYSDFVNTSYQFSQRRDRFGSMYGNQIDPYAGMY